MALSALKAEKLMKFVGVMFFVRSSLKVCSLSTREVFKEFLKRVKVLASFQ